VLMATTVGGTQQSFEAGIPEALFETNVALAANQNRRQYAAAKDGKRFLVNLPYRGAAPQPVTVVLNWPAAIKP